MVEKIGIYGGSFDPVHFGHLTVALETARKLSLDKVILVPANIPPHRNAKHVSKGICRLAMLRLAVRGFPELVVSDTELKRKGDSFTIDTVRHFRREFGPEAKLYFICGSDSAAEMHLWKEFPALLKECQIVFYMREGYGLECLRRRVGRKAYLSLLKHRIKGIIANISSTELRRRIGEGLPARAFAPAAVVEYASRQGLYRMGK